MNKLFKKISMAFVGIAMAVGVGVAIGSSPKDSFPVSAADTPGTLTITRSCFPSGTLAYNATDNWSAVATTGETITGQGDLYSTANQTTMQTKNTGVSTHYHNTVAMPGYITGISVSVASGTDRTYTVYAAKTAAITNISGLSSIGTLTGASSLEISSAKLNDYRFFWLNCGGGASFLNNIVISYAIPPVVSLESIALSGTYPTVFAQNDSFSHDGMIVTATYSDESTKDVTSNATFSGYDMSDPTEQTVTVSYTEKAITKTASYNITVNPSYSITNSVDNATFEGPANVVNGGSLSLNIVPDPHYSLPATLTSVTMNGTPLILGSGYEYNSSTGAFSIASVAGPVVITGACIEDPKYSVTYVAGDNGSGEDYEDSDQYAGSYTLLPIGTTGLEPGSGFSFKEYQIGGVSYKPGETYTIEDDVVITAIFDIPQEYSLFSGALVEGDYVVFYDGYAMKAAVSNNRFEYAEVTPVANKITDPDESIIWHISRSGSYWTLFNDSVSKYAGGNGTKNQSALYDENDASDSILWTVSGTSSYNFVNKRNDDAGVNKWLRNNGTYGFACYADSTGGELSLYKLPAPQLDSVSTSGQTTSFTSGNKFSYGGTLTAHYTLGKADASVSPNGYKYGTSGINPTSAGTVITTDTTLTYAEHNGKYIYVLYTEDDITKYVSYPITVNYAAVSSVVIDTHEAEIGLNTLFDYTSVAVTVNSEYANPEYEWVVAANTVDDDYDFDGSGLLSGNTEGTVTLRCRSTADNSKYDELVVTINGDPDAEFTPASVEGVVGTNSTISFTYTNISNENTNNIAVASNNSKVTVGVISASNGSGTVAINFSGVGNAVLTISYNGGDALDTVNVEVIADYVTALNWSGPNFKVYSGATLNASIDGIWQVNYEMASGDADYLTYGEYTLKLGGSEISLPHTWAAEDDGKTLSVEYLGFSSSVKTVDVTQTLNSIQMPNPGETHYDLVNSNASLAAGRYLIVSQTDNIAFDGSLNPLDAGQNGFAVTIVNGVIADDETVEGKYFDLTVSDDNWTITSASGLNVAHSGSNNGMNGTGTNSIAVNEGVATILGGGGKGLAYNSTQGSSNERFRYYTSPVANANHAVSLFKLIQDEGEGYTELANVASHEAAQKAVVKFAKAFNAAMDTTSNCSTNMISAWSAASSAYDTFKSEISALSASEQVWAYNMLANVEGKWTDDTDSNYAYCLERAMATYDVCISSKHNMTNFITNGSSEVLRSGVVNAIPSSYVGFGSNNNDALLITLIVAGTIALGGGSIFLIRRRREN